MDNIDKMKEPMSDKNPMWEAHDIKMDDKTDDIREGLYKIIIKHDVSPLEQFDWERDLVRQIVDFLKSKNVVRLADNQELPECVKWAAIDHIEVKGASSVYKVAQQDMVKNQFRKVRNLDGTEL